MSSDEARYWVLTGLGCAALALAWYLLPIEGWFRAFGAWAGAYGALGLSAYAAIFLLATLLVVPCTPLTIAGAIAFGWWALPVTLAAAMAGSSLAFLLGRSLLRERIRAIVDHRPGWRATVEAVGDGDWHLVTLMRLSPVVPFNAQNYALAVTDLGTGAFLVSTLLGMLPGTVLCVYLGIIGRAASAEDPVHWISLGLGLAATVAAVWITRRRVRAKLRHRRVGALA